MPGYFVHIASAPEDIRSSVVSVKSLIVSDLWKKHTPSKEEYVQFFKGYVHHLSIDSHIIYSRNSQIIFSSF